MQKETDLDLREANTILKQDSYDFQTITEIIVKVLSTEARLFIDEFNESL